MASRSTAVPGSTLLGRSDRSSDPSPWSPPPLTTGLISGFFYATPVRSRSGTRSFPTSST